MKNHETNKQNKILDMIELKLISDVVCCNFNRLCIFYLLNKYRDQGMQVEKIASILGVSHRTALYHLDVLKDYELAEVYKYKKKGSRFLRSVWGIKNENQEKIRKILQHIRNTINICELEKTVNLQNYGNSKRGKITK